MADIQELTTNYVTAFNARDLDGVAEYLAEGFELTDPDVKKLTPKKKVLDYIKQLFDAHETLIFEAHSIFVDRDASVIDFTLTLDSLVFDGVDIIRWEEQKMTNMKAYLTPRQK